MTSPNVDPAYNTVARDDFAAMIDVSRYGQRSPHFDEIIARTEEHFWNPDDPDYIRWDEPLATDESIMPFAMVPELHSAVADRLDDGQKIALADESARWVLSNILHGEQGALSLSTSCATSSSIPGRRSTPPIRRGKKHVTCTLSATTCGRVSAARYFLWVMRWGRC